MAFVVPQPAYALGANAIFGELLGGNLILTLVYELLGLISNVLIWTITKIGEILQSVVNLKVSAGGPVVYTAWRILRDFCNMAFIVVLILMAFGTIFDILPFGFLKSFSIHQRGVIPGFLMAALLLNFSLAIGQTVVGVSNQATGIVLRILPVNLGNELAQSAQLGQLIKDSSAPASRPIIDNVDPTTLTPTQQAAINALPLTARTVWNTCTRGVGVYQGVAISECWKIASTYAINDANAAQLQQELSKFEFIWKPSATVQLLTGGAYAETVMSARPLAGGQTDGGALLMMIVRQLYKIFLLAILLVSFAVVFIFMLVRIPMLWVLLALSPLAFVSLSFPKSDLFKKWWKQFFAWNVFSPMYLFMIYFGLYMIQQLSRLTSSLSSTDGGAPFIMGYLSLTLTYVMVAIVFIGGTAAVLKSSFLSGTFAGKLVGQVSGSLGMSGAGGAATPVARFLGNITGARSTYRATTSAIGAAGRQVGQDFTRATRSRLGLRTSDELEASLKRRLGVRGAAEQESKLTRARVDEQKKVTEFGYKQKLQNLENQLSQARTDEERELMRGRIKKLKESNDRRLSRTMTSGGRDAQLAAGEILMAEGKLSAEQLQSLGDKYGRLSPDALAGFVKRRNEQIIKDAEKRKYEKYKPEEGGVAKEMEEFLALIGDPKEANKYLEAAGKGTNKFWALDAGVRRKLIKGSDGQAITDLEKVIEQEAPKFKPEDWINAETYYHQKKMSMAPEIETQFARSLLSSDRFAKMLKGAKGDQRKRLEDEAKRFSNEIAQLQIAIKQNDSELKQVMKLASDKDAAKAKAAKAKAAALQSKINEDSARIKELQNRPRDEKNKEEPKKEEKKEEPKEEKKDDKK
jgi:hypothetical protein